jgi:hypothetical protein
MSIAHFRVRVTGIGGLDASARLDDLVACHLTSTIEGLSITHQSGSCSICPHVLGYFDSANVSDGDHSAGSKHQGHCSRVLLSAEPHGLVHVWIESANAARVRFGVPVPRRILAAQFNQPGYLAQRCMQPIDLVAKLNGGRQSLGQFYFDLMFGPICHVSPLD